MTAARSLLLCALGATLALASPAQAFHFPWDQGHDTTDWDDPTPPGPCEGPECDPCSSTGSPVYLPTGHLLWTEQDIQIPGRPGLTLARTYNSHDPRDGIFGNGWTSTCEPGVFAFSGSETDAQGQRSSFQGAVWRSSNGKRFTFRFDPATGGYSAPVGRHERITRSADGGFQVVARDGSTHAFDAQGRLLSEAIAGAPALSYSYDAAGRLQRLSDGAGRAITFTYNSRGRVDTATDSAGRAWRYGYDASGNLVTVTDPAGGIRKYEYQDYRPPGDGHTYSHLVRVIDEAGVVVTQVTYAGERVASYTVGQNRLGFTYNPAQRTVIKTDSMSSRWTLVYSSGGKLASKTAPLGGVQALEYDSVGNLVRHVDPLQHAAAWTYDSEARLTSATNPAQEQRTWTYTGSARMPSRTVSPSGRITEMTFDANGNLTSIVDPSRARTSTVWTQAGHLRELRDALGRATSITTDPAGLPLTVKDPEGRITTFAYDAAGAIMATTSPEGNTLRFERDLLGRVTAIVAPSGGRTSYTYDAAGRVLSVTNPAGQATRYEFDSFGRAAARVMSDGRRYVARYRSDNLVSEITRPDGVVEAYTYDADKRLIRARAGTETVSYTYNARNELVSVANASGTLTLAYDAAGRLTEEVDNGQRFTYRYNADGERVGLSVGGASVEFTRDARGLVTAITAPEGRYTLEYDLLGRRTSLTYPHGAVTRYTYNGSRLSRLAHTGPFTETFDYEYGGNGLISRISSSQGESRSYTYDKDGQLISAASSGGASLTFTYDAAGNLLGGGRTYDAANRLTQDERYTYGYDRLGNLLQKEDRQSGGRTAYTWNPWNQLLAVETFASAGSATPSQRTAFTYGPLRRRWSKTVDGVTERYAHAGLDRVLTLDAAGTVLDRATFGPRVDEPLSLQGGTGVRYLHADHLGSVVGVSGPGQMLGRYQYGPYGEALGAVPAVANPFRYTAREHDRDDLYYYRARYYDPQMRRFLSEDPLGIGGGDTNLYRYAANNPLHLKDPSGELVWLIPLAWGAVEVGLAIYDAYDTASTVLDPCKSAGEKWLAGGLFVLGAVAPGGGYSAADDIAEQALRRGRRLPDDALVCRGGTCTADRFANGSGVTLDDAGRLQGVSVESKPGASLEELTATIPNKQVGVTTVGEIRAAGGDVVPSPTNSRPNHCTMCGITPQQAEQLFTPTVRNPNAP